MIRERFENKSQGIIDERTMRKYAVLLPLMEKGTEMDILFEVRAKHMKRQPGEICFPGGKVDRNDRSPAEAAIRELCEEVGVTEKDVTLIGNLDRVVSPFNHIIYPYVGLLNTDSPFMPNENEVDELFTVPLSFFQQTKPEKHDIRLIVQPEDSFPYESIPGGKNYPWNKGIIPEYFYFYSDKVIWGMTARIIKHFIEELNRKR
nr:CoA pyrophosphatase [Bacillus piscicola]